MNPISLTMSQVTAIRLMLESDDDDQLLHDTIEGETDAFEWIGKLLAGIEDDEGVDAALAQQIDDRRQRQQRVAARIKARRGAIMAIMDCAGLDKLTLPEATLSKRVLADKLVVNDPAAVPDEYTVPAPKPSMDKIKAAFAPGDALPNWLRTEAGQASLTIRRK